MNLFADKIKGNTKTKVWWKCEKGEDHIWEAPVQNRLIRGCPFCSNRKGYLSITDEHYAIYLLDVLERDLKNILNQNIYINIIHEIKERINKNVKEEYFIKLWLYPEFQYI